MPSAPSTTGTPRSSRSSVTNSSPKVRGSTKRSSLPSSRPSTTWVCGRAASSASATSGAGRSSAGGRRAPRRRRGRARGTCRAGGGDERRPVRRCDELGGRWRRTVRAPVTSTTATVRPSDRPARPRRTVSTSGSSGTVARRRRPRRSARCDASAPLAARRSACFFERPSPRPTTSPSRPRREELRRGRGRGRSTSSAAAPRPSWRGELLQAVLRVAEHRLAPPRRRSRRRECSRTKRLARLEPAVEVDRADQRLEASASSEAFARPPEAPRRARAAAPRRRRARAATGARASVLTTTAARIRARSPSAQLREGRGRGAR